MVLKEFAQEIQSREALLERKLDEAAAALSTLVEKAKALKARAAWLSGLGIAAPFQVVVCLQEEIDAKTEAIMVEASRLDAYEEVLARAECFLANKCLRAAYVNLRNLAGVLWEWPDTCIIEKLWGSEDASEAEAVKALKAEAKALKAEAKDAAPETAVQRRRGLATRLKGLERLAKAAATVAKKAKKAKKAVVKAAGNLRDALKKSQERC